MGEIQESGPGEQDPEFGHNLNCSPPPRAADPLDPGVATPQRRAVPCHAMPQPPTDWLIEIAASNTAPCPLPVNLPGQEQGQIDSLSDMPRMIWNLAVAISPSMSDNKQRPRSKPGTRPVARPPWPRPPASSISLTHSLEYSRTPCACMCVCAVRLPVCARDHAAGPSGRKALGPVILSLEKGGLCPGSLPKRNDLESGLG